MTDNSIQTKVLILMKKFSGFTLIPAIAIVALIGFGCASNTPSSVPAAQTSSIAPETQPAPAVAPATQKTSATGTAGKPALKFVKADSEETSAEDGKGANAVDGDTNTIWHTQYTDDTHLPARNHHRTGSAQDHQGFHLPAATGRLRERHDQGV